MKRILVVAVVALLISSGRANTATPAAASSLQDGDAISSIRQRYAVINKSLAKYKVVKKELAGFSTEGGELTAYFRRE